MSYTNMTTNLELPQWLETDKPNWDIDLNEAFEKIDTFAGEEKEQASSVDEKIASVNDAIERTNSAVDGNKNAIEALATRVTATEETNTTQDASITKLNTDVANMGKSIGMLGQRMETVAIPTANEAKNQSLLNAANIVELQKPLEFTQGQEYTGSAFLDDFNVRHDMTCGGQRLEFPENYGGITGISFTFRGSTPYTTGFYIKLTNLLIADLFVDYDETLETHPKTNVIYNTDRVDLGCLIPVMLDAKGIADYQGLAMFKQIGANIGDGATKIMIAPISINCVADSLGHITNTVNIGMLKSYISGFANAPSPSGRGTITTYVGEYIPRYTQGTTQEWFTADNISIHQNFMRIVGESTTQ